MFFKPFRFPTDALYELCDLLTVRKLYVLNSILKLHGALPYDRRLLNKIRKDIITSVGVRTSFARHQSAAQSAYLYNRISKIFKYTH